MATRLTHRQKSDLQSYTILALGRAFAVTGQSATTLAGRKLTVPDRIPYSLAGYDATLTHGNLEPSWTTVPTITFTQGTAGTHSLTQYVTNWNGTLHQMQYYGAERPPTGITLLSTGSYSYNGVGVVATSPNVQIEIVDSAEADWVARSTAAGVTYAQDFRSAAVTSSFFVNGGDEAALANISRDTTDGVTGGACLRIITPTTYTGTNSAVFRHPLNSAWTNNSQHFGTTPFYIFWMMKINAGRLVADSGSGWKYLNVAQFNHSDPNNSPSNVTAEIVGNDGNYRGVPVAYHQDGNAYPGFEFFGPGGNINYQNMVDKGIALPDAQRYCLYGTGPTYPGCEHWPVGEWFAMKMRIRTGTYGGSTNNEFDLWMAPNGATTWTHLIRAASAYGTGFTLGVPGAGYGGLNGLHWHVYDTGRTTGLTNAEVKYDQIIVSTNDVALPSVWP